MVLRLGTHIKNTSRTCPLYNCINSSKLLKTNALQIFTKSPMRCGDIKFTDEDKDLAKTYLLNNDIYLVVHGQYILNFCKPPVKQPWAIHSIVQDLLLIDSVVNMSLPTGAIIHMGKNTLNLTRKECILNFKDAIEIIIDKLGNLNINLILETSVRSKNDIFYKIEDLAELYNTLSTKTKENVKFCIDTCHIFASGYDISTKKGMQEYFTTFDKLIGLKNVILIHLNDSQEPLDSGKDRHKAIGQGFIFDEKNLDNLQYLTQLSDKHSIPVITETAPEDIEKELNLVRSTLK